MWRANAIAMFLRRRLNHFRHQGFRRADKLPDCSSLSEEFAG